MQRYFEQLVEDIQNSYRDRVKNASFPVYSAGTMLHDVPDKFVHLPFHPAKPIYQWMNIDVELFPPLDRWTTEQLYRICELLRCLFEAYEYSLITPWDLSPEEEYPFFIEALRMIDTCTAGMGEDSWLIEIYFCKMESATCPFKENCMLESRYKSCNEYQKERWWKYECE